MLDLIERYWTWKVQRKCNKFRTAHGYIIHRFRNEFGVVQRLDKATKEFHYIDLRGDGCTWLPRERAFCDRALRSRSIIESKYGALIPITDEEEEAHYARSGK